MKTPPLPDSSQAPPRGATIAAWLFALLALAGVIAVVVHLSELEKMMAILRRMRPRWLLVAAAAQGATYFCAAGVWRVALAREGEVVGILPLAHMALMMLFTNQAFPSAGLSGSAVVVRALRERDVPSNVAMGALLVGLMTTYIAYLVAVIFSLVLLRVYHAVNVRLLLVTAAVAVAAVVIPAAVVWYRESIAPRLQVRLRRVPGIGSLLDAIGTTPTRLLHDRSALGRATALQLAEILLDATTLQVMLTAIGVHLALTGTFGSYAMAAAVSRIVPVPLGLGSFEAALVAMLHTVGVSLEAALTATLLLRGFTFWLPMLPGLWYARQELWMPSR